MALHLSVYVNTCDKVSRPKQITQLCPLLNISLTAVARGDVGVELGTLTHATR